MTTRPPALKGLRHLALVVENYEECQRFYRDVLGMRELSRYDDDLVYYTLGNDNLSLGRARAGETPKARRPMDHFGFVVASKADLQAWYDYLKAEGVEVLDEPTDHFDGARSFHVKDPAGNVVQPIFHPAISGQEFTAADGT